MNVLVRILSVAILLARESSQNCVDETLDCSQPVPTIYKLGYQSCNCDSPEHAGALKYANGRVYLCIGNEWKVVGYEAYGSENNPGLSCKDILTKAGRQLANGIYWIHLQAGNQEAFPVFCDMVSGGWTLVFKVVSGVDRKVWDLYSSSQALSEFVTAALDVTNQHRDHYKNRVVMNWQTFNPTQAKVVLYEAGIAQKELLFDAQGTDQYNWFTVDKLISSPWTDVKTEPRNYFSIHGWCRDGHCRSFFINRNYGGCDVDAGWLVSAGAACSWETSASHKNGVLYSKLSTHLNWNDANNVAVADVLAVFVL